METIRIPERFKNSLAANQELNGVINSVLYTFGEILKESKLYFFSEYTNHGVNHVENILIASNNLITEDTYQNILTEKDIGYHILSVLLHDIGMHIELSGFRSLINGDFDDVRITEIDQYTWSELWEDFLSEAKRFGDKQLKAIFGDENVIIRIPTLYSDGDITENDKRLIGEFIRRHHCRLAHEIAIKGFPGRSNLIEFAQTLRVESQNLIGLIARSHGMNLRSCINYIEEYYGRDNRRFPDSVHAVYIMILLRIGDYIQIDNSRTSKIYLKIKTFSSPISEIEHNAHLAIDGINFKWHDDPERIFVNASPKDSNMFLKLKELFKSIQYELDISWAVLGELYGKEVETQKAKIKYRRISSNIEDRAFLNKQKYIADNFNFKANDGIIGLLINPLYGSDPKYGVRELLQNAIDACKERELVDLGQYTPTIKIEVQKESDGFTYFSIYDNGIGMDVDVIKNYFLKAGASYRNSKDWQKEFINEEGKSIVRRSGRFGVGVLAAFLIGKDIYVETKKYNSNHGLKFHAQMNMDQINVVNVENVNIGTLIKIKIDEDKIKQFNKKENSPYEIAWYEWYTLSKPKVQYYYFGKEIIPRRNSYPDDTDKIPSKWHSINSFGYNKILWTYEPDIYFNFTCNGIIIPDRHRNSSGLFRNGPRISVFDHNGFLPLSLDRNRIAGELSFNKDLLRDLYKDFIAYILMFDGNSYVKGNKLFIHKNRLKHPATLKEYGYEREIAYGTSRYLMYDKWTLSMNKEFIDMILLSKKGFIINYSYFINKLSKINAVMIDYVDPPENGIELDIRDRFVHFTSERINSINDFNIAIEGRNWEMENQEIKPIDARIYLKSDKFKFLFNSKVKRISAWIKNNCNLAFQKGNYTCLYINNPESSIINQSFLDQNSVNLNFLREYEIICPFEGDELLDSLLKEYIGDDVIIPFSLKERMKKFSKAFMDLEFYMKKYEKQA